MKQLSLFIILVLFFSCNSNEEEEQNIPFDFSVDYPNLVEIDKPFDIEISANDIIESYSIKYKQDFPEWVILGTTFVDLGADAVTRTYAVPHSGVREFEIIVKDVNRVEHTKVINIEAVPNQHVKINGITVNDFFNKGDSWDPEYASDNPERLADLQLFFNKKSNVTSLINGGTEYYYFSPIHMNEESYYWNLSNDNLYMPKDWDLLYSLADRDNGSFAQGLYQDQPLELRVRLSEYEGQSSFTIDEGENDLSITLDVAWP